jgi:hypothetical protein
MGMCALVGLLFGLLLVSPARALDVGAFSAEKVAGGLPAGWKPLTFRNIESHTAYALERDDGAMVVRATSRASASGLARAIEVDVEELPILEWRWKVENLLEKGDVTQKSGDDFPARIYVAFDASPSTLSFFERIVYEALRLWYGEAPPLAAINYIWERQTPVGTIVPNAFTNRVQMIVVESGPEKLGRWVDERRDLAADYRRAFGEAPPKVKGVAIMTDTDGTGEAAVAWYGDIRFVAE